MKDGKFRLGVRKNFFTVRVVRSQNRFPQDIVDVPTQVAFKATLDKALSNLVWGSVPVHGREIGAK